MGTSVAVIVTLAIVGLCVLAIVAVSAIGCVYSLFWQYETAMLFRPDVTRGKLRAARRKYVTDSVRAFAAERNMEDRLVMFTFDDDGTCRIRPDLLQEWEDRLVVVV